MRSSDRSAASNDLGPSLGPTTRVLRTAFYERILKKKPVTSDRRRGHDAPMNRGEFSRRTGLSTGTISKKREAGVIVAASGCPKQGAAMRIDPWPSVKNLLTERASQPEAERSIVNREQAERLRIANRRERGELLEANLVDEGLKGAVAGLLQDWDALAQRVTSDTKLQDDIARELRAAQQRFSDHLDDMSRDFKRRAGGAGDG